MDTSGKRPPSDAQKGVPPEAPVHRLRGEQVDPTSKCRKTNRPRRVPFHVRKRIRCGSATAAEGIPHPCHVTALTWP